MKSIVSIPFVVLYALQPFVHPEHEARGEVFRFDPTLAAELLEAAIKLQIRGLQVEYHAVRTAVSSDCLPCSVWSGSVREKPGEL